MISSSSDKVFCPLLGWPTLLLYLTQKTSAPASNETSICSVFKSKQAVGKLLLVVYPVCDYVVCTAKISVRQRGGRLQLGIQPCVVDTAVFNFRVLSYKISFDPELKSL